jgi:TadE-like protein
MQFKQHHRQPLRPRRPTRRRSERGQGLVEFALMLMFLTVLLMGVLDLGRAYFSYLALKDAAQEGAYFGSAFPQCQTLQPPPNNSVYQGCNDPNNIPYRVGHSAPQGSLVNFDDPSAYHVAVDAPVMQAGQLLTVTVSYQYKMLTPFVGAIANGQTLTLTARSSAVIVRVPNCQGSPCT